MGRLIKNFRYVFLIMMVCFSVISFADETENVKDNLELLSSDELYFLQSRVDTIKDDLGFETVIVITDDTKGKDSEDYADDFFDYGAYGVGEDYTGVLLLINMDTREIWISTSGDAIDVFTDERVNTIVNAVINDLKDSDFYGASNTFLTGVEDFINKGVPSGQYREDESGEITYYSETLTYREKVIQNITNPFIYLGALGITIVVILIITFSSRGKVTVDSRTYENANGFKLTNRIDQYISQTTTRRKIETKSSGGGSSTHSGSSGRSHGGGGGSF